MEQPTAVEREKTTRNKFWLKNTRMKHNIYRQRRADKSKTGKPKDNYFSRFGRTDISNRSLQMMKPYWSKFGGMAYQRIPTDPKMQNANERKTTNLHTQHKHKRAHGSKQSASYAKRTCRERALALLQRECLCVRVWAYAFNVRLFAFPFRQYTVDAIVAAAVAVVAAAAAATVADDDKLFVFRSFVWFNENTHVYEWNPLQHIVCSMWSEP